jgi:hypothetical protein
MKTRRMKWTGHVVGMEDEKCMSPVARKSERKRLFRRLKCKQDNRLLK